MLAPAPPPTASRRLLRVGAVFDPQRLAQTVSDGIRAVLARRKALAKMPRAFTLRFHFYRRGIMEEKQVITALAALAQPSRLRIFRVLVVGGLQGMTPGTLSASLGLPPATLSFHLKTLAHAGLVSLERSGRNLIYRAEYAHMNGLLAYLTANCCEGEPCAVAPSISCVC